MKRHLYTRNDFGLIWSCRTADFSIELRFEPSYEPYDGDDEDGSIQRDLDNGDLVMFDSKLTVYADTNHGIVGWSELGTAYLSASCYKTGETHQFIRDWNFRDMLKEACDEARETLNNMPKLRAI